MPVSSCLEFRGKTRAVPGISPVKRSWLSSGISKHLTQVDVSSVSHPSPVKQGNQTVLALSALRWGSWLASSLVKLLIIHILNFHLSQAIPDKSFRGEIKQVSKPETDFPKSLALKQQEGAFSVKCNSQMPESKTLPPYSVDST